jgi:hypothetical protein
MNKLFLSLITICTLLLFSCKNNGGGDPKAVLAEFIDALGKKDMATARTLATAESKSMLDLMEMGMKSDSSESLKYDKSKMEFGEAKIEGDKATVPVKETTSGETINYTLKKEEGSWKVAFDKSSLMNIGMEKMNEKGINPMDSLQSGLDKLNEMDVDSIKQGMREGMKMLDSVNDKNKNP